jgi:hypothetical protein
LPLSHQGSLRPGGELQSRQARLRIRSISPVPPSPQRRPLVTSSLERAPVRVRAPDRVGGLARRWRAIARRRVARRTPVHDDALALLIAGQRRTAAHAALTARAGEPHRAIGVRRAGVGALVVRAPVVPALVARPSRARAVWLARQAEVAVRRCRAARLAGACYAGEARALVWLTCGARLRKAHAPRAGVSGCAVDVVAARGQAAA